MLLQTVRYFRKMGFFSKYESISDEVLSETLEALYREEWNKGYGSDDTRADLLVLKFDESRVWWQDTEADVCDVNRVYVETFEQWGAISEGVFVPKDINETWASEEGPIEVSFALNGQLVKVYPQYANDYIDMEVLGQINELIRDTGRRFEVYEFFDQTAFVIVLTREEKKKLEMERGWRFARL